MSSLAQSSFSKTYCRTTNFFSGNTLNRLSWLRPSHHFLNTVLVSPATWWIIFKGGEPLVTTTLSQSGEHALARLSTNDVLSLLDPQPFFGQAEGDGQLDPSSRNPALESARHRGIPIVFLGLQEHNDGDAVSFPSSDFQDPHRTIADLQGTPFFSMDVADVESEKVDAMLKNCSAVTKNRETLIWMEPRAVATILDASVASVFAQAKSMVDWNRRNKFCPACGAPVYSLWGGWKLSCATLLPWFDKTGRKPCLTERGLHNFAHPRTDSVVIMIAVDQSGERILLGRNKNFPRKFYSALSGFIEPGESFEDAVKREMWEEAGVKVWDVRYHSGQPWPYPATLMVAFYATADSSMPLRTDLDNELEDAKWYNREEVLAVLRHPQGTKFSGRDRKHFAAQEQKSNNVHIDIQQGAAVLTHSDPAIQSQGTMRGVWDDQGPPFRVPPLTAIAGVLIRDWAERNVAATLELPQIQKGNL